MVVSQADPRLPLRVLLIDDDAIFRAIGRKALNRSGFQLVAEGKSGKEGIELAKLHKPDLVLLDVQMPDMDGFQALPHIRTAAPASLVVMLSSGDADQGRLRASGMRAAFLSKSTPLEKWAPLLERLVSLRDDGDGTLASRRA